MPDNILLEPLNKFYSNKNNLDELLIILNHKKKKTKKKLSLRLIDWFVTNYCKKEKITIRKKNKEYINIYDSYKSNLKAFSKKVFDPFRRKTKIILHYYEDGKKYKILYTTNIKKKETYIDTTVGQLNFFKWVIEKDMIKSQKENNNKKLDKNKLITKIITTDDGKEKIITRKKRNELSKNKSKNINLQKIERTLYF